MQLLLLDVEDAADGSDLGLEGFEAHRNQLQTLAQFVAPHLLADDFQVESFNVAVVVCHESLIQWGCLYLFQEKLDPRHQFGQRRILGPRPSQGQQVRAYLDGEYLHTAVLVNIHRQCLHELQQTQPVIGILPVDGFSHSRQLLANPYDRIALPRRTVSPLFLRHQPVDLGNAVLLEPLAQGQLSELLADILIDHRMETLQKSKGMEQSRNHVHFLSRMAAPVSRHSWLPTQQLWKEESEVTMLPPIQLRYLRSVGQQTDTGFTFTLAGAASPILASSSSSSEPYSTFPPDSRTFEYSSFFTSTSQLFTVSATRLAAPLKPELSSPQRKLSLSYRRSRLITCLSGSSYSMAVICDSPASSCLLTERDSLMSLSSCVWWNSRKEGEYLPLSWYLLASFLPVLPSSHFSTSNPSSRPAWGTTLADLPRQKPSWTATDLVKLSPESSTRAEERPVAKQESTGAFRKKTLATLSRSKRNSEVRSRISFSSCGLAATSSLSRTEQSARLTPSSSLRLCSRKAQSRSQSNWQPSAPFLLKMLRTSLSLRSAWRCLSPTRKGWLASRMASSKLETAECGMSRGASSPPQPMRARAVPMSTTSEVISWNIGGSCDIIISSHSGRALPSLHHDQPRVVGVDQAALADHSQLPQRLLQQLPDHSVLDSVARRVGLVDHFAEVVAARQQEVDAQPAVGRRRVDGRAVRQGGADEAVLLAGDADHLIHSEHWVEAQRPRLHDREHLEQLCAGDVEGDEVVGEGEHVVEVLEEHCARVPLGAQASGVDDHEVALGHCVVHQRRNQVRQLVLPVSLREKVDLALHDDLQEAGHLRHPFLLEDRLHLRMRLHLPVVEAVRHQLAGNSQLLLGQVLAGAEVGEDALADGNGPFDDLFDERGAVELEVEDVEVEAAVDGAEVGHSLVEVVSELVAVTLQDAVDGAVGQRLDQLGRLVVHPARLLRSVVRPSPVSIANRAVVAHVASHQHCVGAALPQLLRLRYHHVLILQELVLRELLVLEGVGGVRSEDSRQSDHSNPDAAFELIQLGQLLLGQELAFPSFRTQVGCQGGRFLGAEEGQQHFRPEVELVVADGRATVLDRVEEVIHDLAGADERRGLNAALELVAGVQDKRVARVLTLDGFNQRGHVDEPAVGVVLLGVGALQGGGQGGAVDVVGGDHRDCGELPRREPHAQQQQQVDFHHINTQVQIINRPRAMRATRCSAQPAPRAPPQSLPASSSCAPSASRT